MNGGGELVEALPAPRRQYTGGAWGILFVVWNLIFWGLTGYGTRWSGEMVGLTLCWGGLVALGVARGCFTRKKAPTR